MMATAINLSTRRTALRAIASVPVIAAPPVAAFVADAGDHPDAELLRLGAECIEIADAWRETETEQEWDAWEGRYASALDRIAEMEPQTLEGLAMQLRVQFMRQCENGWNVQATRVMDLTDEQLDEIDGYDLRLFELAQTAMRLAGGRT